MFSQTCTDFMPGEFGLISRMPRVFASREFVPITYFSAGLCTKSRPSIAAIFHYEFIWRCAVNSHSCTRRWVGDAAPSPPRSSPSAAVRSSRRPPDSVIRGMDPRSSQPREACFSHAHPEGSVPLDRLPAGGADLCAALGLASAVDADRRT